MRHMEPLISFAVVKVADSIFARWLQTAEWVEEVICAAFVGKLLV
jgi:hypothetical protein